jgi:SM-20-related protein
MQIIFDALIDSYLANKVGIANNFFTEALADNLKNNLLNIYAADKMQAAGIGNATIINKNALIRTDKIFWLDRAHNDTHENAFFDIMDAFVIHLNSTCYTGITSYEFHYALYEKGSFYKTHIDQFKNNAQRAFSMIMYLNNNWQSEDGGELCIHHTIDDLQFISPTHGKSIFFKSSELAHEVLETHQPRLSITGWLKTN